jgi:hypothetical protein
MEIGRYHEATPEFESELRALVKGVDWRSDSDAAAAAALCEDIAVPQDRQARPSPKGSQVTDRGER